MTDLKIEAKLFPPGNGVILVKVSWFWSSQKWRANNSKKDSLKRT